jgi:hypothetical protein
MKKPPVPREAYLPRILNTVLDEMNRRGTACPEVWGALEELARNNGQTMWSFLVRILFGAGNMRHHKQDMQRRWLAMGRDALFDALWGQLLPFARIVLDERASERHATYHARGVTHLLPPPPPWLRG